MSDVDNLLKRIDDEFSAVETRMKSQRAEQVKEYEGRQQRMEKLHEVFSQLGSIWRPRLEALATKFGDKVKVSPHVTPSTRAATFKFQSALARIDLQFSATTDQDVRTVILAYDLEILPVLMKFEAHSELSVPLDKVDPKAVANWVDDRIVAFVKTYLSLHENNLYLKDVMVEDCIANVQFPKFAAGASLKYEGKTYYFINDETRDQFARSKGIAN
jgi:YHS domain-containing protein